MAKLLQMRRRIVDCVVVLAAVSCCAAPFVSLPFAGATSTSLLDVPITVDQQVHEIAMMSKPLSGTFSVNHTGKSVGQLDWNVYSSSGEGFKLTVASDSIPAMLDPVSHANLTDFAAVPAPWSTVAGNREFGFSVQGAQSLDSYGQGADWRGFSGNRPIEVARQRNGPSQKTETTILLGTQVNSPLPANASPNAFIVATSSMNL